MKGKKILFVDDEENVLNSLKRELYSWAKENEISLLTATSGGQALKILKKEHQYIPLIVSDLHMPNIKGSDLLLKVKELYPDIMSILLTAYTEIKEIMKAVNAGIFSYILKPWDGAYLQSEIQKALNIYTIREDNKKYLKRIEEELTWAGELQKALLKFDVPHSEKVSFSITYSPLPGLQCGGDYYDIIHFGEDRYLILIGDVSGHGVKAAFVTSILKSIIYSGYVKNYKNDRFSPAEFLSWLNNRICYELRKAPDMVITFAAGVLDLNNHTYIYSNAGHMPLYLVRNGQCKKLYITGPAIGFMKDISYQETKVEVTKEDRILIFTDGLVEIGKEKEILDQQDLEKIFIESRAKTNSNEEIINRVKSLAALRKFRDDVTLISIHLNG